MRPSFERNMILYIPSHLAWGLGNYSGFSSLLSRGAMKPAKCYFEESGNPQNEKDKECEEWWFH